MSGFASASLSRHLARGALAVIALVAAVELVGLRAWWGPVGAIGAASAAMLAMRGCPICWTVGLVESAKASIVKRRS